MRSLESVVKDIRATCPPIAGVANGAMVLNDSLFTKMTTDKMQEVLGPKIEGSNNVDQMFHDDELDFFVLFSSASCVVGNVGQSNYAAANGYINSLVLQRRRRGLAASTFDIGQVAGIGYIETAGQVVMDQLAALGLRPLSETDLRQAFAETIRSGYPDPKDKDTIPEAVLTTGIRYFSEDEDVKGPWFSNPFFSHCVIDSKTIESESEEQDKKTTLPAARQLSKATTREQALDILKGKSVNGFSNENSLYYTDNNGQNVSRQSCASSYNYLTRR
jgi:hybrid polyketide synthase/nonribosomal peptide synthetase ACE1